MKMLYLVRHAKAIPRKSGVNDFKRSLSPRGEKDARAISKRLRQKGILPDLLLSSPADRALETAHIFAKHLKYPALKILIRDSLYDQGKEAFAPLMMDLDDHCQTVMIVGHEPALSQWARELLPEQNADLELRTASVVGIGFNSSSWQAMTPGSGLLVFFDFPIRATPAAYKKARRMMTTEMTSTIQHILEDIDAESSPHVQNILKKTSKKLAKELTNVLHVSKVDELARGKGWKRVNALHQLPPQVSDAPEASAPVSGEQSAHDTPPAEAEPQE